MSNERVLILGIGICEIKNDGLLRFERYCKAYNLDYIVAGYGNRWTGGDLESGPGGGQKINQLIASIKDIPDDQLIIACDTFDLFPIASNEEIITKYHSMCKQNEILISSEIYCWPCKLLANAYPKVNTKYRYLNSGCVMGYRKDIFEVITQSPISNTEDDQLFFTKMFFVKKNIMLDYNCEIFQTINGVNQDLSMHRNRVYNKYTESYPIFLHGNGPSKKYLNQIENYIVPLPRQQKMISCGVVEPLIFIAIHIDSRTNAINMDYPFLTYSNKVVHIYDKAESTALGELAAKFGYIYHGLCGDNYVFDTFRAADRNCEYYLLVNSDVKITDANVIHDMLQEITIADGTCRIIAPLITKLDTMESNFWGDHDNGNYRRSADYYTIMNRNVCGIWNVAYVSGFILFHANVILDYDMFATVGQGESENDRDLTLCNNLRRENLFMYLTNYKVYGYLE